MHLARGALRLAEVYGGALLAEEMEQVARYVDAHSGEGRADADGLDALMRAMEQLPAYVERVASGGRDLPLVLLPLLNDLRAVRGGALLSEGTLLLLNLRSDEPAAAAGAAVGRAAKSPTCARRLRPRFQLALLGWIRGEQRREQPRARSPTSPRSSSSAATTQPLFQLWWVVGAVLEALREGGLDGNVSVKRLLGHADREMQAPARAGEQRYAAGAAGRAAQQPAVLRRARAQRGPARRAACASRSASHELLPPTMPVGGRARRCRRRACG